jgi:HEPN domain-containing protein
MDTQSKVEYWLDLVEYDLETVEALLAGKRYLYVGFFCHMIIEKTLKALFTKIYNEVPPKIHKLNVLVKKNKIDQLVTEEIADIIDKLEPLNIEARYPTYKQEISKILTKEYTIELLKETKELMEWIKMML